MQGRGLHNSISACWKRGLWQIVWVQTLIVAAAASGLLVARSVPTEFATAATTHSVVSLHSSHDQRPRFDNAGSQWSIPIATFAGTPPASERDGANPSTALVVPYRIKGAHYTRPPPIS